MKFGPTFYDELQAAGVVGLPFSWGDDGVWYSPAITAAQRRTIEQVIAAHDPTKPYVSPRTALRQQIQAAQSLDDLKIVLDRMV